MNKAFIAVILMAVVTYLPRAIPVSLFRREIKSKYIRSFLKYVPYAVLGALTFPEIFYSTGSSITALCGTLVAIFLAYKEKSLVVVAVAAILTVYVAGILIP
jgi:branched-subunit amino acid transport protein